MKKVLQKFWRYLFWTVNRGIVPIVVWKKHRKSLKVQGDKLPKAPFIMVSNHANFLDPWIVCHYSTTPVAIMMNEEGFKSFWFQRWVLKNIGAFPKKKGLSDVGAMKKSIAEIRAGYPLMIFPEGQTSWDGETQPIYSGIEKMAQKFKIPIVMCRIEGNFIAHPWWATFPRVGQITVQRKVLSPEEVAQKSSDELRDEIITYIKNHDIEKSKNSKFTGQNLTAGMQNLLWLCPTCNEIESLKFENNSIKCEKCKKEFVFNANLYLETPVEDVKHLHDWVKKQKLFARNTVKKAGENDILCTSEKVHLIQNDNTGRITTLDIGDIKISKKNLVFSGDAAQIVVAIDDIVAPVFQQKNIIQFEYSKGELKFMFLQNPMMKTLCILREMTGWEKIEENGYL